MLAQADLGKEFAKLAREHAALFLRSDEPESTGMNRRSWVVACVQIFYVVAERFSKREYHGASGLAGHEPQFASGQINVAPAKCSDVGQALTCIDSEENHRTPLRVGGIQDDTQLFEGEVAPVPFWKAVFPSHWLDKLCWIFANEPVPARRAEEHPHSFQIVIDGFRTKLGGERVAKGDDFRPIDAGKRDLGAAPKEGDELSETSPVKRQSGARRFGLFRCQPLRHVPAQCRSNDLLARNLLVQPVERLIELLHRTFGANGFFVLFRDFAGCFPVGRLCGDPPLATVQVTEASCPILRTRMTPNACHGNNNISNNIHGGLLKSTEKQTLADPLWKRLRETSVNRYSSNRGFDSLTVHQTSPLVVREAGHARTYLLGEGCVTSRPISPVDTQLEYLISFSRRIGRGSYRKGSL